MITINWLVLEINKNQCLIVEWVSIFINYHWLLLINIDFIDYEISYLFSIKRTIWIHKLFPKFYLLCFMLLQIECLKKKFAASLKLFTSLLITKTIPWNPMGMQEIIKTWEKRVQSNHPGHKIHPWFITHVHSTTHQKCIFNQLLIIYKNQ